MPYVFAIFSIIVWSFGAVVSKITLNEISVFTFNFFLFLSATVALAIICFFTKRFKLIKKFNPKDYLILSFLGILGVAIYYFFYSRAYQLIPAQQAYLLNYSWPVWIVIFTLLLNRDKGTPKTWISILLGFLGISIIITQGAWPIIIQSKLGAFFALMAGFSYGLFSTLGRRLKYDTTLAMFWYFGISTLALIPVLIWHPIDTNLSLSTWGGILWMGVISGALGFTSWFHALKKGNPIILANLIFLAPTMAIFLTTFLLPEETLHWSSFVGLGFVIFGIVLQRKTK